jgi:hypothetical protein
MTTEAHSEFTVTLLFITRWVLQWPKERRTINTMAKEKKDNQYNGQRKKKDQRTNNDLRNIAYKTKVQATRTPGAPEG